MTEQDPITYQELREKYNPDGSLLRRQQMKMLDMLIEVDRICKRHNIPYWLSSGTLIGAARHKGFIPWDDDLDIEMLLPDYNRLMSVLETELPSHLALQTTKTDKNYFFFYAKIRDRRSLLDEGNGYDRAWKEKGIYIDIFPFHPQPLWVHLLSEKLQGHTYKIMRTTEGTNGLWRVRAITRINERVFFPMLRLLCRLSKARETYALGIPYHDPRHLEDIFPLTELEFEGHLFPVPGNTHAVLTLKYGNYMQMPDLTQLHPHVSKLSIND